jgi:hypothetical protein
VRTLAQTEVRAGRPYTASLIPVQHRQIQINLLPLRMVATGALLQLSDAISDDARDPPNSFTGSAMVSV